MLLYRLTRCFYANDLSGTGARLYGGRWNSEGRPALYLASSRSLAVLEALVHLTPANIPNDYCMAEIEVPDDFIDVDRKLLPPNWDNADELDFLKQLGDAFLLEKKSILLKMPSAIVDQEYNYLLNPMHKNVRQIKVKKVQPFTFDSRLFSE